MRLKWSSVPFLRTMHPQRIRPELNAGGALFSKIDFDAFHTARIAANAFLNSESEEYRNKAISLDRDSITPNEAARMFKEVTGEEMPSTWSLVGRLLKLVRSATRVRVVC